MKSSLCPSNNNNNNKSNDDDDHNEEEDLSPPLFSSSSSSISPSLRPLAYPPSGRRCSEHSTHDGNLRHQRDSSATVQPPLLQHGHSAVGAAPSAHCESVRAPFAPHAVKSRLLQRAFGTCFLCVCVYVRFGDSDPCCACCDGCCYCDEGYSASLGDYIRGICVMHRKPIKDVLDSVVTNGALCVIV